MTGTELKNARVRAKFSHRDMAGFLEVSVSHTKILESMDEIDKDKFPKVNDWYVHCVATYEVYEQEDRHNIFRL